MCTNKGSNYYYYLMLCSKTAAGLVEQSHSFLNDINNVADTFQHFLRILGMFIINFDLSLL